jgi:hypothetical protein
MASPRILARLVLPVGGRVTKLRAVWDSSRPATGKIVDDGSLRPCLGQGASLAKSLSRETQDEWVKSLPGFGG